MARRAASSPATTEPAQPSAPPPIGHNLMAPPTPEQVTAWLEDQCADLIRRAGEFDAGIERFKAAYPEIPDAEIQGKASDFAGRQGAIAGFLKIVEARRETEKQPYLEAGRSVDGFFKKIRERLEAGQTLIRQRMTVFAERLEAENRRRAKEEADLAAKRAAEAAAEAAATMAPDDLDRAASVAATAEQAADHAEARPAEHSRVYGGLGTVSSLRETWTFEVTDKLALTRAILARELLDPALTERLAKAVAPRGVTLAAVAVVVMALADAWRGEGVADDSYIGIDEIVIRRAVVGDKVRAIPGLRIFANRTV